MAGRKPVSKRFDEEDDAYATLHISAVQLAQDECFELFPVAKFRKQGGGNGKSPFVFTNMNLQYAQMPRMLASSSP